MGGPSPNWLVFAALFGWVPVTLALFLAVRPSRAFIIAYVAGGLFLPQYEYKLVGFVDLTKTSVTAISVAMATFLFHTHRLRAFKPSIADIPMVAWLFAPLLSSLSNGLGLYDGMSGCVGNVLSWGLPYFFARIYLTTLGDLRDVCIGLLIGGLAYLPLCLFEVRMSPQLHSWVYGFHQHAFSQTKRFGGFRPMVFMQHGIAVALYMAFATMVSYHLWRTRSWLGPRSGLLLPMFLGMCITTILCKSVGAVLVLAMGLGGLWITWRFKTALVLALVMVIPLIYVGLRASGQYDGLTMVEGVRLFSADRADSLEYRVIAENDIIRTLEGRPWLGWGGWDRSAAAVEGRSRSMDSAWILVFGENGWYGLCCFFGVLLGPCVVWLRKWPPSSWSHTALAPGALAAMLLALFAVDKTVNYMPNPTILLFAGSLVSVPSARRLLESEARRPRLVAMGVAGR